MSLAPGAAGGAATEGGGDAAQDREGRPLPGFTLAVCREIIGNEIERAVPRRRDLARPAGTPVRLRFVLKDADLCAFGFE